MSTRSHIYPIKMPRRFDRKTGWNRQFKWKPVRSDRWDPFPKDHLPFIDDFSVGAFIAKKAQAQAMPTKGSKRKADDMLKPMSILGKRRNVNDTGTKGPYPKRPRTGGTTSRNLFTNDNVAMMATAGVGAGGMAYTGAGIAMDRLNARVTAGIEEGFARHAAIQDSGVYTYDALTESAMAGRYLTNIAEGMERIVPLVEDLLEIGLLL